MSAIKFLVFLAVAVACVFAVEERVKKDVLVGAAPFAYPSAYSAGYVSPYAYSAGYVAPAAYSAGYVAPAAAAYSAYPYAAGYAAPALRTGLYY